MTPALWSELIGASVSLILAVAAYVRSNTAKAKADTAITAMNQHVMTHVANRYIEKKGNIIMSTPETPQDTSVSNPVGLQGASLMGVQSAAPPPEAVAPVPEPVTEPTPQPQATETQFIDQTLYHLGIASAEELLNELAKRLGL